MTFAGTEFSASGLLNGDTVNSVTLTSAGAAPTATVAGSPYAISPSAAVGTGLGNYTITYVDGELTVDLATLTITAIDATKVYGTTAVLDGTEFIAIGLLNSDLVDSVTVVSPGTPATATVAGSPYPITPSAAVGTGLDNYAITYIDGLPSRSRLQTSRSRPTTRPRRTATRSRSPGTEFTTSGLLNATPSTASRSPARAPLRPRPWPAARTRSRRRPPSARASTTTRSRTSTAP